MDAGDILRTARRRRGLSQAQLAVRAGTTQTAISRLERGARSPTAETIGRLFLVMGDEIDLQVRPIRGRFDPAHLAAERRLTPRVRLERAFAWMRLNAAVAAGAKRPQRV